MLAPSVLHSPIRPSPPALGPTAKRRNLRDQPQNNPAPERQENPWKPRTAKRSLSQTAKVSQLGRKTTNPKLDSYANAASETTLRRENQSPSYGHACRQAAQTAPNRPPNALFQLRRETNKTKLNSYADAANAATSRYENKIFSYDGGRTPI